MHSSVDGCWSCFHVLAAVNSVSTWLHNGPLPAFPPRISPIWVQSKSHCTSIVKAVPLSGALLSPFPSGNFLFLQTSNPAFPLQCFSLTAHWYSQSRLNLRQGCLPQGVSEFWVVWYLLDSGQCLEHNMYPVNLECINEPWICVCSPSWTPLPPPSP